MRIITISREFGSGGRELGSHLAGHLGFDYYDREIIAAIAENMGLDEAYVENTLSSHGWQNVPLTYRRSFAAVRQDHQVDLLLEQKRVVEEIAKAGKDCVIVGRNADALLREEAPFRIFVCADMEAKVRRCSERADAGEALSERELRQMIRRIDKSRARTRELVSGNPWGVRDAYHLTVNTTDWELRDLAPAVAEFALRWFGRMV